MGRLHTCYSPVRRSPADKTEVSSPLPLDLHVLSLSLAFILSQDQTLRCYLSFFFLFYFKKEAKDNRNCCFAFAKPSLFDSGLTPDLFVLRIDSSFYDSCTTLVYCKSFNVLGSLSVLVENFAKLRTIFELTKFLFIFLLHHFLKLLKQDLRPKSECKGRDFF